MRFLICGTISESNGLFLVFADVLQQPPLELEERFRPQLS